MSFFEFSLITSSIGHIPLIFIFVPFLKQFQVTRAVTRRLVSALIMANIATGRVQGTLASVDVVKDVETPCDTHSLSSTSERYTNLG